MADDDVLVPYGEKPSETATLLLGAADELGYEPWVVRNQPEDGGFRVTPDVAKKAKLKGSDPETIQAEAQEQAEADQARLAEEQAKATQSDAEEKPKRQTRKRTAKKAPAKKAAAKKTANKE